MALNTSRAASRNALFAVAVAAALCVPAGLRAQASAFALAPAQIDAVFKDFGKNTPGCAVGIYNRGKILYAKGYGMADLNLGVPITPKTVFDIGSTSKQFAAASIVMLANQGKLSLSDDVRKFIPELPSYGSTITIDHMLRHTSGLRDYNGLLYLGGHYFEDFTDDADALKIIVAQRNLNFAPGTNWDYSNSGFFLLSVIVKRVTGQTLGDFAKTNFFTPLGMPITHFRTDHTAILAHRATAYSPSEKGGFSIDMSDWDQAGDGAVNTNVLELAKWDANFYDAKVGGTALISRMQERGALNNGDSVRYARGLFVDTYRGLRRVHHGGAWAGYRAMLMRFPEQGLSIGLTCNVGNADTQSRSERVADVVLAQAFKEPAGGAKSPAVAQGTSAQSATFDAAPYVGSYFSEEHQSVLSITNDGGKGVLSVLGAKLPLSSSRENQLEAMGGAVTLAFTEGRTRAALTRGGAPSGSYRRIETVTPTSSELAQIVGVYTSAELGTSWTVRNENGKLLIAGRAIGESPMEPVMKDAFTMGQGFVAFTRDASGKINGFEVSASRMLRIRFDR
ncbi:MAG: serine hydrolase [Gemmatimonadetes bacterium]|nr:serine hydrolase [Gemmatimonadota bacterium]